MALTLTSDGLSLSLGLFTNGTADGKLNVTSADTVREFLDDKIIAGTGLTKTVVNPGGDESLQLDATGGGGGHAVWVQDEFTATAGQVTFIISGATTDALSLSLEVNGIAYDNVTDYTVSGTTVTWTDVAFVMAVGDKVIIRYY